MSADLPPVIIVAHGQPSDPKPAALELTRFAVKVSDLLPGREVASATLAEEGALAEALEELGPKGLVFPLFMAGGWFTRVNLPAKLRAAGAADWQVLEPFGCDPALHDLAVAVVAEALTGQDPAQAQILLAAHGSGKSAAPADIAVHVAAKIAAAHTGARVEVGFIEQSPQLSQAKGFSAQAICLPFFAAAGGHVTDDLPAALAKARFKGRLLPPLGLDPRAAAIVADAILAAKPVCAQDCRFRSKD